MVVILLGNLHKQKLNKLSEIYKYIEKFYDVEENRCKKTISRYNNYIKKIPKLVRKNGLILTIAYLNKKANGEDGEIYKSIIETYVKCNKDEFDNISIIEKINYFLNGESKEKELKRLSIKTINFFEKYSILADGYGCDINEK